jgi:ribokinase
VFELLNHFNLDNSIIVLPDFFMDRIVRFSSEDKLIDVLNNKIKFGGGSIRGIQTFDIKGGNAVNVAYCLAKLGLTVTLFTVANKIGAAVLQSIFSKFGKKVDLNISEGKHGTTTSLEFEEQESVVNIMMSDVGDLKSYGADRITNQQDLKKIQSASCVILTNWASNHLGTELASHVFSNSGNALHFIDPADIDSRRDEFRDTLKTMGKNIDVLSINENECNSLTHSLGLGSMLSKDPSNKNLIKKVAKIISAQFGIEVDLHTRIGSAWSNGKETDFESAFDVEIQTLTGSGDCWDAADAIGYLAKLPPNERLLFSNACSALYIQNKSFEAPSMNELIEFLHNHAE